MFGTLKNWWNERDNLRQEIAQIKASISSSDVIRGTDVFSAMTNGSRAAGRDVNEYTAMSVAAVYACVQLKAGAIAGLPLPIYKRTGDSREKYDSPISYLLNVEPNPITSSAVFWEYIQTSIMLHGDGFARILRDSKYSKNTRTIESEIIGFEPLHPLSVQVRRYDNRLAYGVTSPDKGLEVVDQADMLHMPGVGFNGFRGMSPLRYALRNSVGIALAADEYSADFFANGSRADFVLKNPGAMLLEQANILRETWGTRHGGPLNKHLPAVLTGGMEIQQLTMSAEDTQLIETRRFEIEEIARICGVPPHMIGHSEKSTSWGSGIEQLGIGFVKYSLRPDLNRIENEINRKLFQNSGIYCEFNVDGLMEGDSKAQGEYFTRALGGPGAQGWMSVNDVRRLKNQAPIAGGDKVHMISSEGTPNATANSTTN